MTTSQMRLMGSAHGPRRKWEQRPGKRGIPGGKDAGEGALAFCLCFSKLLSSAGRSPLALYIYKLKQAPPPLAPKMELKPSLKV